MVFEVLCSIQVMRDVALKSTEPLTCVDGLARFVAIDAPSSAPSSNAAVDTSPHLHTLSDPAYTAAANTALECVCAAIQSACSHRDSLSNLRSMLQRLRQIRKEEIEESYAEGKIDVDGLKSLLQELSSFRYEIQNIMV